MQRQAKESSFRPHLQISDRDDVHPLPPSGTIRLGRGTDADLRFDDDLSVSRRQIDIRCENGTYLVVPISSTVPTQVNGRSLSIAARLKHGDAISFGKQRVVFHAEQPPSSSDLVGGASTEMPWSADTQIIPEKVQEPHPGAAPITRLPERRTEKVAGASMNIARVGTALLVIGLVLLVAAFAWWLDFYSPLVRELDRSGSVFKAFSCLYSSGGPCGWVSGLAATVGKTPYEPAIFWIGAASASVGGIIRVAVR